MHSHKLIAEHFRADSAEKPGEQPSAAFATWGAVLSEEMLFFSFRDALCLCT